ncbi:MAG TPA: DNA polymerase III [Treponemataceae bacterium]|nr:DNA polymerase III [Treponemataceae bacterium]
MFENVLYQNAVDQLIQAIENKDLPQSLLFFGPSSSAKLTTALELARVLSCKAAVKGEWLCSCSSCAQHKLLVHQNLLLLGPRETSLEIAASEASFLKAISQNAEYKEATKFLFLRSIRKLLLRYHPVLLQDDDQASKVASHVLQINELLEELEQGLHTSEIKDIQKITESLVDLSVKLEAQYSYDSIPVLHIRNLSYWARLTSSDGKKIVIIENADRMLDASKNALLKILEEPPKNLTFILLTTNRNALLPTILSRLRPYYFQERKEEEQKEVIERVFHLTASNIEDFLLGYLPVSLEIIQNNAKKLYAMLEGKSLLELEGIIKDLGGLKSRLVLSLFFNQLFLLQRESIRNADEDKKALALEKTYEALSFIKTCYENIRFLHQNPQSAFESLAHSLLKNKKNTL